MLAVALASIRALEGPDLRVEILLGDNGGLSETAEVAARFGARVLDAPTPGAAAARNAAMRAATGEFIAFLDDDDAWLPGHIQPQLGFLAANPGFAAAVGRVVNTSHLGERDGGPWPDALPAHGDLYRDFLAHYPQIGATVIRAAVRDSVGYFDERLTYDEDWDWHLRLALRHRVGFVPTECVLFRQRPPGQHDDLQWRRLGFAHRVLLRNLRRAGWRRNPPAHVVARLYLRKLGPYSSYFSQSAILHVAAGERRQARRAFLQSLAASPAHFTKHFAVDASLRHAARESLL